MNDNGKSDDFNELVDACAGKDRKEQERYLSRVVMQLVIKRYGRDPQLPDANYLRAHGVDVKDVFKAMQVLDAVYSVPQPSHV